MTSAWLCVILLCAKEKVTKFRKTYMYVKYSQQIRRLNDKPVANAVMISLSLEGIVPWGRCWLSTLHDGYTYSTNRLCVIIVVLLRLCGKESVLVSLRVSPRMAPQRLCLRARKVTPKWSNSFYSTHSVTWPSEITWVLSPPCHSCDTHTHTQSCNLKLPYSYFLERHLLAIWTPWPLFVRRKRLV